MASLAFRGFPLDIEYRVRKRMLPVNRVLGLTGSISFAIGRDPRILNRILKHNFV